MTYALTLGEHVNASAGMPPAETRDAAIRLILDTLGATAAGLESAGASAVRQSSGVLFGPGSVPILFADAGTTAIGAVFCNASAACALDVDDGHRGARGHPGAAVVSTVLALAHQHDRNTNQLLAAIVAGYDVGARVAAAQNSEGIATRQSGRWISYATAAAAAAMMGLSPLHTAQALSIAGVLAPNQRANGSSGYAKLTGNDVKEGIAWGSITGITAAQLASCGHTGPLDLLDHAGFYNGERLVAGLGSQWEILQGYFKPYACCRYIHPALDRLFELTSSNRISATDIVAVEVETFGWASRLSNRTRPQSLVDVQYSLPYCLAIALVEGPAGLLPVRQAVVGRTDLETLAGRVHIATRPDIDQLFPAETLARVTIETASGRYRSQTAGARGEPRQKMDFDDIEGKFRILTRSVLTPAKQQRIIDAVIAFAGGDPGMLLAEIQSTDPAKIP